MTNDTDATHDKERDDMLRAFYRERLGALAELARSRGIEFFSNGPESSRDTYYVDRTRQVAALYQVSSDEIGEQLRERWIEGQLPELADIAGEVKLLADALYETEGPSEDVSPFIYAMF